MMRVETCVSLIDMFSALGGSGIECKFKSVKTSLVTHGRNLLTAGFLNSDFEYMLFVDADVEFKPEAVMRMLVPKKDIVCTPYRVKEENMKYAVKFKDSTNIKIEPFDLVEIEEGPAGLMLIQRKVFERLMDKHPELKINFNEATRKKMNEEIGADTLLSNGERRDAIALYMYNFWDTTFNLDSGEWKGEDLSFCSLAREEGFRIYANLDSGTTHHGSWGWKGRFGDYLVQKKAE